MACLVVPVMHQERLNGAGVLVRQRDRRHILVASAHEFRQPAFCEVRFVLSGSDHRSGTMNQNGSVKSPVAPATWLFFDEILIDW
jgi:hypothetical protein